MIGTAVHKNRSATLYFHYIAALQRFTIGKLIIAASQGEDS